MKILIIEDDINIVNHLELLLRIGYPDVKVFSTQLGEEGIEMVCSEKPKLIVLDLALPDINGFEVLKRLRLKSDSPVIVLTVSSDERSIITALQLGADDYVVKPFKQMEFLARVKAVCRRYDITKDEVINTSIFSYNFASEEFFYKGTKILTNHIESKIVGILMENIGRIVTNQEIENCIWENGNYNASEAIRVYVYRLRKSIKEVSGLENVIQTRSGIGYIMTENHTET